METTNIFIRHKYINLLIVINKTFVSNNYNHNVIDGSLMTAARPLAENVDSNSTMRDLGGRHNHRQVCSQYTPDIDPKFNVGPASQMLDQH